MPQRVSTTIYENCRQYPAFQIKTVLDAEGELLLHGLEGKPYIIKPNLFELETALDIKITSHQDIIKAAKVFLDKGVKIICVSLGGQVLL